MQILHFFRPLAMKNYKQSSYSTGVDSSCILSLSLCLVAGVLLQTPPPLQTFPPEDLQWYWKTIADLPPLLIFPPDTFSTVIGFIFIYSY